MEKLSLKLALDALKSLGLKEMDAQVYIYLAKKGPHEKNNLAYALNADDQQLCCILKNLQEKGFVTMTTENRTVFVAVPLEEVINNILKAKSEETQNMERDKEKFLSNPSR
jgi:sugar-specific transcriptional regulator TrmB